MRKLFLNRNTRLWTEGPDYTGIGLERLERSYDDDGKPSPKWSAVFVAHMLDDVDRLRNFPESAEVVITHKFSGRMDDFVSSDVVMRLSNCKPVRAWFENVTQSIIEDQEIVPYRLLVECDMDYTLDMTKIEADEAARVASIKPTEPKPKKGWRSLIG